MNRHNLLLTRHAANRYGGWFKITKRFRRRKSQQYNFFSREIFHLYRHHQTLLFCTMYYTNMYYILYNTINVKYLKTCSGLQDQRSGTDYNLIDGVLLLYSSLVLIVGSKRFRLSHKPMGLASIERVTV